MTHAHPRGGFQKPRFAFNRSLLPTPLAYFVNIEKMKLVGSGAWRTTLCPFHADQSPSLRVNVHTGGWRCMSCGAHGGDVLAYHMQRHDLAFIDACKALGAWENAL